MHPELLRALGKARHEELLNQSRSQGQPRLHDHSLRFHRSRERMGILLIWAGTRILGDQRAELELVHDP
jgi:hypothetical protein